VKIGIRDGKGDELVEKR